MRLRLLLLGSLAALAACAKSTSTGQLRDRLYRDIGWVTKAQLEGEWGPPRGCEVQKGLDTCVWILREGMVLDKQPAQRERGDPTTQHYYTQVTAKFRNSKLHSFKIDDRTPQGKERTYEGPARKKLSSGGVEY